MSGDTWRTPDDLFKVLDDEFNFEVDLCAGQANAKCNAWSEDIEAFIKTDIINDFQSYWINPPYSRGNIDLCMRSVVDLNNQGKHIVSLTRFDPSAKWFKENVVDVAKEVRMLDTRVKFIGAPSAYNFPCCIAIYDGYRNNRTNFVSWGWKNKLLP